MMLGVQCIRCLNSPRDGKTVRFERKKKKLLLNCKKMKGHAVDCVHVFISFWFIAITRCRFTYDFFPLNCFLTDHAESP